MAKARPTAPAKNGNGKTQKRTLKVKAMPTKKSKIQSKSRTASKSAAVAAASLLRAPPPSFRLNRPFKPRTRNSIGVTRGASRSPVALRRLIEANTTSEGRTRKAALAAEKVTARNSPAAKGKGGFRNGDDMGNATKPNRPRRAKNEADSPVSRLRSKKMLV